MAASFDQSVDYFDRVQRVSWYGRLIDDFLAFVDIPAGSRLLDVGCGPGLLTRKVARQVAEAVGLDISPAMVERATLLARRRRQLRYVGGDVSHIPFPECSFDVVTATAVLYLLADQRGALEKMVRVTRPGGLVATMDPSVEMRLDRITVYAPQKGITGFDFEALLGWMRAAGYHGRFSVPDLVRLYERVGLKSVRAQPALDGMVLMAKGRKAH